MLVPLLLLSRAFAVDAAPSFTTPANLDAVAKAVGEPCAMHDGTPPPATWSTWLAWRVGVPAEWVSARCAVVANPKKEPSIKILVDAAEKEVPPGEGAVVTGSQKMKTPTGGLVQVAVAARLPATVDALPKSVEPGKTFPLQGTLRVPAVDATVYLDQPGRGVWHRGLVIGPDGSFKADVPVPGIRGVYYLEVRIRETSGSASSSVLFLPVYVGVPEPSYPDNWLADGLQSNPAFDPATRVLQALNTERRQQDLAPMVTDARVVAVANEITGLGAGSDIRKPLESGGVPYISADTAWMRGPTPEVAVKWSLLHPGFRSLVLDQDVTRTAVAETAEATGRAWMALLVAPIGALDPAVEAHRLYVAANDYRMGNGQIPFHENQEMNAIARDAAIAACQGATRYDDTAAVGRLFESRGATLDGKDIDLSVFTIVQGYVDDMAVRPFRDVLVDPRWDTLAVGTCQGDMPDHPGAELAVFVALGVKK